MRFYKKKTYYKLNAKGKSLTHRKYACDFVYMCIRATLGIYTKTHMCHANLAVPLMVAKKQKNLVVH